mmetsp:Transcript_25006/g.68331  ORF Transcript_25006/g.68331 Transcript_25006/m.68331 type:complete len:235 (-) Transcript_25006:1408-2112(-)
MLSPQGHVKNIAGRCGAAGGRPRPAKRRTARGSCIGERKPQFHDPLTAPRRLLKISMNCPPVKRERTVPAIAKVCLLIGTMLRKRVALLPPEASSAFATRKMLRIEGPTSSCGLTSDCPAGLLSAPTGRPMPASLRRSARCFIFWRWDSMRRFMVAAVLIALSTGQVRKSRSQAVWKLRELTWPRNHDMDSSMSSNWGGLKPSLKSSTQMSTADTTSMATATTRWNSNLTRLSV